VARHFKVGLGAQGYDRFVFNYQNTHDITNPIWIAGEDVLMPS
jgi:hypothetical protein